MYRVNSVSCVINIYEVRQNNTVAMEKPGKVKYVLWKHYPIMAGIHF